MNDKEHKPPFSTSDYIRPNTDWVCGRQCEGKACRIGPTGGGKCRATYECQPLLEIKPGETKGHYKCTRPSTAGGKCDLGPLPDGTCCNAVPKCQPRRTLRAIRKRVTIFTAIACCLALFIGLDRTNRDVFINPGPLSNPHSNKHFSNLAKDMPGNPSSCGACHESARGLDSSWLSKFGEAFNGNLAPGELIKKGPLGPYQMNDPGTTNELHSGMDKNCLACHKELHLHTPSVVTGYACHSCHQEHVGGKSMIPTGDSFCIDCHSSAQNMGAVATLSDQLLPKKPTDSIHQTSRSRPATTHIKLIKGFHDGHPDFWYKDKNNKLSGSEKDGKEVFRFNHAIHIANARISYKDESGKEQYRPLSCTDCHVSDDRGEYQLPITYEKNCKDCHPLNFDVTTPSLDVVLTEEEEKKHYDETMDVETRYKHRPGYKELVIPHGDTAHVRSFLRSLNLQYEEHAKNELGITQKEQLKEYVNGKTTAIIKKHKIGNDLEHKVFYSGKKGKLDSGLNGLPNGCILCHEFDPDSEQFSNPTPKIMPVPLPKKWFEVGKFNHETHEIATDKAGIDQYVKFHNDIDKAKSRPIQDLPEVIKNDANCLACHEVLKSEKTSDVLLPGINNCINCHSPETQVDHSCMLCHTFHNKTGRTSLFEGIGDPAPAEQKEPEEK